MLAARLGGAHAGGRGRRAGGGGLLLGKKLLRRRKPQLVFVGVAQLQLRHSEHERLQHTHLFVFLLVVRPEQLRVGHLPCPAARGEPERLGGVDTQARRIEAPALVSHSPAVGSEVRSHPVPADVDSEPCAIPGTRRRRDRRGAGADSNSLSHTHLFVQSVLFLLGRLFAPWAARVWRRWHSRMGRGLRQHAARAAHGGRR